MSPRRPRPLGQLGTDYSQHLSLRARELARFSVATCVALGRRVRTVCANEAYELERMLAEARALRAATDARSTRSATSVSRPTHVDARVA